METFTIIEDGQVTFQGSRREILSGNAYDLPVLIKIMQLLQMKMPCQVSLSDLRCPANILATGRSDDYIYIIKREEI
jgi:hypothetical protein